MIFIAATLSVAAVSTVAFQPRPPPCSYQSLPGNVSRRRSLSSSLIGHNAPCSFDWSLPYASKSNSDVVGTTAKVPTLSIHSLLEAGRIDDAVADLRKSGDEVPASTYHAVMEACCAGGFEPKRKKKTRNDDRIEIAAELLQSMEDVTAHAHEIIISGYARRGRWRDAHHTLSEMEKAFGSSEDGAQNKKSSVALNVYQAVLAAFARAHQFDRMNSLLTRMRRQGVRPNVYTYNSLLKICASDKVPRWKEALSLLSQCQREPGVNPDLITYTTAMKACARGRQTGKALELFRAARDMGMKLDVYFYTTAMDACAKGKRRDSWKRALSLLDEMKEKGIAPNEVTYGVAVAACGNGGRWRKALELLDTMREARLEINTITYNSAIAALSKAARSESRHHGGGGIDSEADLLWEKALELVRCMEGEGVRRDSFTFSSAISACGAAGRWQEAVNLIEAMKGDGIKPNKVAYTAAITACANSRRWEPAFELFRDVKEDGIQPDIVAYNALIGAGMTAEKPAEVFDIWQEMCQSSNAKVSPDIVTLTEVVATLDSAPGKASRERVDRVFAEAVARGLILRKDSLDTSWEVDLSHMSFPVARAACRFIFRQIVESEDEAVKDLSLITGASRMREYVREVLRDELRPAVYCIVPELEQGTLQVKEKMMRNYIEGQRQQ
eukprot:CAMPEP_0172555006 /NCGR_PEP_ID=MMETSP1067-20121228/57533_1 /TAXON_ID=265564 ORGANISM="Thalassiosira punctigera, Strain Tpunct2005C2" /NCGR_SAMPLE_ID=MMETSP1067 /ASSEMBLY_ACC=CAM_ASM_000444 /LENGTH=669 /DNA_ID=CAMNT_0013343497 /DNA_START=154 /DNA_END=2163 /DNA_ORIENTATION=-